MAKGKKKSASKAQKKSSNKESVPKEKSTARPDHAIFQEIPVEALADWIESDSATKVVVNKETGETVEIVENKEVGLALGADDAAGPSKQGNGKAGGTKMSLAQDDSDDLTFNTDVFHSLSYRSQNGFVVQSTVAPEDTRLVSKPVTKVIPNSSKERIRRERLKTVSRLPKNLKCVVITVLGDSITVNGGVGLPSSVAEEAEGMGDKDAFVFVQYRIYGEEVHTLSRVRLNSYALMSFWSPPLVFQLPLFSTSQQLINTPAAYPGLQCSYHR